MIYVQLRIGGLAETHPVAFPFLILFAFHSGEGRAVLELAESFQEVGIEN
jgi:hypothetical protein